MSTNVSPSHDPSGAAAPGGSWPKEYADLDFELPEELIATHPAEPADHARLMVVNRAAGTITHDYFFNLGKYLAAGDAIFYNATQVEARRVQLKVAGSAKVFECVFLKHVPPPGLPPQAGALRRAEPAGAESGGGTWQVLMRNIRRVKDGTVLHALKDASYEFVLSRVADKIYIDANRSLEPADFARIGEMPLPPYMKRAAVSADSETYQNFFSRQIEEKEKIQGSAAAPTAALHFTQNLFATLREQGITFYPVCLDIGYGTFAPLTAENFASGELHAEHYYIPENTAAALRPEKKLRRIALGTTSLRALISYSRYAATEGETKLFVKPGDAVSEVEGLITNFHLPQSSLLLLVTAFCNRELLARAYREAIQQRYRFYSYGDAMLII